MSLLTVCADSFALPKLVGGGSVSFLQKFPRDLEACWHARVVIKTGSGADQFDGVILVLHCCKGLLCVLGQNRLISAIVAELGGGHGLPVVGFICG